MNSRRKFLAVLGGGVIFAAAGAAGWAATRDPQSARQPWLVDETEIDPRRRALSYAVLAPNPHNRQPWLVDLSVEDEVTLYCQDDRRLPETDPFDRQITIGLGCFIELFVQGAGALGYRVDLALFPGGEPQPRLDGRPVAHMRLVLDSTITTDPLFDQALLRRSYKLPFDTSKPVAPADLQAIATLVRAVSPDYTVEPTRVDAIKTLGWEAMYIELVTDGPASESLALTRIGKAEIEANPDGISLSGPLIEGLSLAGLLSRKALHDTTSSAFAQQLPVIKAPFDTAMAFMWLITNGNTRADQIAAGRDYLRINMAATAMGIGMGPLSQALQEYPEMAEKFEQMRVALDARPGATVQMLARLGYGSPVPGAPRWPAHTRIIA